LVQLPEVINPKAKGAKPALAFLENLKRPCVVSELTKERLSRASLKVKKDNPGWNGDSGFRVFKLDHSNIRAWNPKTNDLKTSLFDHLEHLEPGRSSDDILYEILLKLGLDLCVPIEQREIAGKQVNSVGTGVLMACLNETIKAAEVEALALGMVAWRAEQGTVGDTTAVFRDSAFENDVAKSNLAAILEQHGIKQVRSL
jgi:adenine-specific DNA-methyltransferase